MNINDWVLSGGGMEGESYFSPSHPELMMKVYPSWRARSFVENEFRQPGELLKLGISVPEALELTEYKGCPAIISQRIGGKKSFCKLAGEKPGLIPSLAGRMAAMARELHSKPAADGVFPSEMEKFRRILEGSTVLDADAKSAVLAAMDRIAADDRCTLLHGDLHFGNIITDGSRDYFIDLGDVSFGHPNHDLAMFYITTHYGTEHSFDLLYHLSWRQALEFWEAFKTGYYGREISDEEVFAELKDYMLARVAWFKHDQIQTALLDILSREHCPLTCEVRLKDLGE